MTKIRSMFTLICCSLARLKMSLRTGFCCRNVLAQDKIKMHRKLYLSLPHIGILGVPSPNCMLHLQFWDGALLPPAVLGWHFLTCKFFTPSHLQIFHLQCWDGAFSPAVFFRQIFHMQFWDGTVQGCQIHHKKNQWNHGGFATTSIFFSSDGCMAQRGRCPGGRPSVSANKRVQHAYYSVLKWQLYKPSMNTEYDQQSPRECRYLYWRVQ